jgi:hypothetical protein
MKKILVVKEEYMGQVLQVVIPGMGKVKIDTDKLNGDKSFYIKSGLGYLFEEISIEYDAWDNLISNSSDEVISFLESVNVISYKDYLEFDKNILMGQNIEDYIKSLNTEHQKVEVIEDIKEEEKVVEEAPKVVKNKGGRPRKKL